MAADREEGRINMRVPRLWDVLEGNLVDKTPVISLLSPNWEVMDICGMSFPEAHLDPIKMVRLANALQGLLNLDNVSVPFCLTVEAENLGCKVDLGDNKKLPLVKTHAFDDISNIDRVKFEEKGRISSVLRAVELLKRISKAPVIVPVCGPFTLSSHMFGFEKISKMIIRDPINLDRIINKAVEFSIKYSSELVKVGADIICISDPYAEPEVISPSSFKRFLQEKIIKLSNEIPSKKLLHVCGPVGPILRDMLSCNFDAIIIADRVILENKDKIKGLKQNLGENVSKIAANISVTTLASRTPQDVKERVLSVLEAGADILAICNALPSTPLMNLNAVVEARDEFLEHTRRDKG